VTIVSSRTLHGQVVQRLGSRIVGSGPAPGWTLPDEEALGAELGVSRTVLREAIKVLAAKGLVETRPKTGTRVRPRDEWDLLDPDVLRWRYEAGPDEQLLRDLTEVRFIIEPAAAALAARRATADEVAAILEWYRKMEAGLTAIEVFIDADMGFHGAILAATDNDLLQRIGRTVGLALRFSRTITVKIPAGPSASMPLHRAIAEAIAEHDAAAAEDRMRDLLRMTAADITAVLHPAEAGAGEPGGHQLGRGAEDAAAGGRRRGSR